MEDDGTGAGEIQAGVRGNLNLVELGAGAGEYVVLWLCNFLTR